MQAGDYRWFYWLDVLMRKCFVVYGRLESQVFTQGKPCWTVVAESYTRPVLFTIVEKNLFMEEREAIEALLTKLRRESAGASLLWSFVKTKSDNGISLSVPTTVSEEEVTRAVNEFDAMWEVSEARRINPEFPPMTGGKIEGGN